MATRTLFAVQFAACTPSRQSVAAPTPTHDAATTVQGSSRDAGATNCDMVLPTEVLRGSPTTAMDEEAFRDAIAVGGHLVVAGIDTVYSKRAAEAQWTQVPLQCDLLMLNHGVIWCSVGSMRRTIAATLDFGSTWYAYEPELALWGRQAGRAPSDAAVYGVYDDYIWKVELQSNKALCVHQLGVQLPGWGSSPTALVFAPNATCVVKHPNVYCSDLNLTKWSAIPTPKDPRDMAVLDSTCWLSADNKLYTTKCGSWTWKNAMPDGYTWVSDLIAASDALHPVASPNLDQRREFDLLTVDQEGFQRSQTVNLGKLGVVGFNTQGDEPLLSTPDGVYALRGDDFVKLVPSQNAAAPSKVPARRNPR